MIGAVVVSVVTSNEASVSRFPATSITLPPFRRMFFPITEALPETDDNPITLSAEGNSDEPCHIPPASVLALFDVILPPLRFRVPPSIYTPPPLSA